MKGWIFLLAILTVGTGVMEAVLFQFMGTLVDWLGTFTPERLWQEKSHLLIEWLLYYLLVLCGDF